jgi:uncharacterized membrane protein required for colicin V production
MDQDTFHLAAGVLIIAIVVVLLDAALASFETPDGLWTMLVAFAAFLGARGAIRNGRRNGWGEDE